MRLLAAGAWALATALTTLSAAAQDAADDTAENRDATSPKDKSFSHALQFGLRASIIGGYRTVFRYDDSPLCTQPDPGEFDLDDQQKFCGHMGPAMFDVAVSFAPLGAIEPFIMGRFGLVGEKPTNTRPLQIIAVGTRLYTRRKAALKIFVEPSLGVEFEGGADAPQWTLGGSFDPEYKTDVIFRAAVGPQFDFSRNVGAYAQVFGMSVGVLRYIHATIEFGAGVQARFP